MTSRSWDIKVFLMIFFPQIALLAALMIALISGSILIFLLFGVGVLSGAVILAKNCYLAKIKIKDELFSSNRDGIEVYEVVVGIAFTFVLGPLLLYYSPILRQILREGKEIDVGKN